MNPIQVHCPECQKLFYVRAEDLKTGQARFQCTSCKSYFAFNWPQAPDVSTVRAQVVDPHDFKSAEPPKATATINTAQQKVTKSCVNCGEKVDIKSPECPKCGVVFEKVRKLKTLPVNSAPPARPEIVEAWQAVRAHYQDEKRHEGFIQLCLNSENLAYASSMYRAVLDANPAEEIAKKMQNRILELATAAYLMNARPEKPDRRGSGLTNIMLFTGLALLAIGGVVGQLRSLIAVGAAIIVFVLTLRYFNRRLI